MQVRQIVMTPEHANRLLAGNTQNRKYRDHWANELSKMIVDGAWKFTHQAIAVSKTGRLLDGQHRLNAVIKSGISVPVLLAEECDEDMYVAIDKGVKRSLSDSLGMDKSIIEPLSYLLFLSYARSDRADLVTRLLNSDYGYASKLLLETCNTRRRGASSSTIRAAVIAKIVQTKEFDQIAENYRKFVLLDYDTMPKALLQLEKQMASGQIKTSDRPTLFAKSYLCFDPNRSVDSTYRCSESSKLEVLSAVRSQILSALGLNAA